MKKLSAREARRARHLGKALKSLSKMTSDEWQALCDEAFGAFGSEKAQGRMCREDGRHTPNLEKEEKP
jgi:hypothetical protein